MRSLVFVVATLLVAMLTTVQSEMNSSFVDDENFHRDARVTVDFGAAADSPMTITSGSDEKNSSSDGIAVKLRSAQEDPSTFPEPEEPSKPSNMTRPKRYCLGTVDAVNAAIFKKRGIMNINSTGEESSEESGLTRTARQCVNIPRSKNVAIFKKRGSVDSNSATESQPVLGEDQQPSEASNFTRSERATIGTVNSIKTVIFKKRGSVDSNSTAEQLPVLGEDQQPSEASNLTRSERATIGNFNSLNTNYYLPNRILNAQSYASPVQQSSFFSDYEQPSASFYYSQSDPYYAGLYNSLNTAFFRQSGTANSKPFSSTAERIGAFAGQQLSSDSFFITETQSNSGGVPTIQRTVVFKKRGDNPPSSDMDQTGQLSESAGSVNGSLSA